MPRVAVWVVIAASLIAILGGATILWFAVRPDSTERHAAAGPLQHQRRNCPSDTTWTGSDRDVLTLTLESSPCMEPDKRTAAQVRRMLSIAREVEPAVAHIRARPYFSPTQLLIDLIDDSDPLRTATPRETGVSEIDELNRRFNVSEIRTFVSEGSYVFVFAGPLYIPAVAEHYERVAAVEFAMENRMTGDGDNIVLARTSAGWTLDFSRGWMDCPAGCLYRRYWRFTFDNNLEMNAYAEYGHEQVGSGDPQIMTPKGRKGFRLASVPCLTRNACRNGQSVADE